MGVAKPAPLPCQKVEGLFSLYYLFFLVFQYIPVICQSNFLSFPELQEKHSYGTEKPQCFKKFCPKNGSNKIVCKQRFHYNIQNNNWVENTKESVIQQRETTVYKLGESWDEQQFFSWKMIFCRKINWILETQLSNSACPGQALDYSFSFLVGRHLARAALPIRQVKIKVTWLAEKFTWPGWPEDTSF